MGDKKNADQVPEAEKVLMCSLEDKKGLFLSDEGKRIIKQRLSIVEEGWGISIKISPLIKRGELSRSEFERYLSNPFKFKILETNPKRRVKVTEDTELRYFDYVPNEDRMPKSKIRSSENLVDLEDLEECSKEKFRRIARASKVINKFEDDERVVYFTRRYFYTKQKAS